MNKPFLEHIVGKKDEIANCCDVSADDYFITVDTEDASAMFHYSVAKKLRAALGRAIKHVEAQPRNQKKK